MERLAEQNRSPVPNRFSWSSASSSEKSSKSPISDGLMIYLGTSLQHVHVAQHLHLHPRQKNARKMPPMIRTGEYLRYYRGFELTIHEPLPCEIPEPVVLEHLFCAVVSWVGRQLSGKCADARRRRRDREHGASQCIPRRRLGSFSIVLRIKSRERGITNTGNSGCLLGWEGTGWIIVRWDDIIF
jgi:hypothetical protein